MRERERGKIERESGTEIEVKRVRKRVRGDRDKKSKRGKNDKGENGKRIRRKQRTVEEERNTERESYFALSSSPVFSFFLLVFQIRWFSVTYFFCGTVKYS